MKGHTKIELTNVETGEVTTYEEDNIVTNWMRDAYNFMSVDVPVTYKYLSDRTLWNYDSQNLHKPNTPFTEFGGIIAFEEQLEENPDNYFPKGQLTMTAHSGDDAYTGVDLTRGSFNEEQSSYDLVNGSCTLVWDFTQEQGNGTIGTVCLCNHNDGKLGYGSKYDAEYSNDGEVMFYHHGLPMNTRNAMGPYISSKFTTEARGDGTFLKSRSNSAYLNPVKFDAKTGRLVSVALSCLNNKNILFVETFLDGSTINPIQTTYNNDSSGLRHYTLCNATAHNIPIDVIIKSPSVSSSSNYDFDNAPDIPFNIMFGWIGIDSDGNFWFSEMVTSAYHSNYSDGNRVGLEDYANMWKKNTVKKFTKVDLDTFETTEYSVTNTTGEDIWMNCGFPTFDLVPYNFAVSNNNMFIVSPTGHIYAIDLSNNANVHKITDEDNEDITIHIGNYIMSPNNKVYYTSSSSNEYYNHNWVHTIIGDNIIFSPNSAYQLSPNASTRLGILNPYDFKARKLCSPNATGGSGYYSSSSTIYNVTSGQIAHTGCWCSYPIGLSLVSNASSGMSLSVTIDGTTATVTTDGFVYIPIGIPLALITINRLSSPVTKTATSTMRITYTITS